MYKNVCRRIFFRRKWSNIRNSRTLKLRTIEIVRNILLDSVSFVKESRMTIFLTIRPVLLRRYQFSCLPQDKQEREEEQRKTRIQLYVFISRCIAYPFNAKQPMDMTRRQMKVTKQQLETICSRFQVNR